MLYIAFLSPYNMERETVGYLPENDFMIAIGIRIKPSTVPRHSLLKNRLFHVPILILFA